MIVNNFQDLDCLDTTPVNTAVCLSRNRLYGLKDQPEGSMQFGCYLSLAITRQLVPASRRASEVSQAIRSPKLEKAGLNLSGYIWAIFPCHVSVAFKLLLKLLLWEVNFHGTLILPNWKRFLHLYDAFALDSSAQEGAEGLQPACYASGPEQQEAH